MSVKRYRGRKRPIVSLKVEASCQMFATFEMQCPLCKLMIPANTPHNCEVKKADAQAR